MHGDVQPRLSDTASQVIEFAFLDNPELGKEALSHLLDAQSLTELGAAFEICNLADPDWNWGRVLIVQALQLCKSNNPLMFDELKGRWQPWLDELGQINLRKPHPAWAHAVFDVLMRVVPLSPEQEHQLHPSWYDALLHIQGDSVVLRWDGLTPWEMVYYDGEGTSCPLPQTSFREQGPVLDQHIEGGLDGRAKENHGAPDL